MRIKNYYQITVDGIPYSVEVEADYPDQVAYAPQQEFLSCGRQATWVNAQRVAHLPAR